MTELEAVRERHSVRSFLNKGIDPEVAGKLKDFIEECNREGGLHMQFLPDAGNTFGKLLNRAMGLGSAPSAIACIGPDGSDLDEKVGYYGEKIVLYAQGLGLNTCWVGMFKANGVECALLAPTAINQQKFVFCLHEDGTVSAKDGKGPFSKVDLGIVKYHFELGAGKDHFAWHGLS